MDTNALVLNEDALRRGRRRLDQVFAYLQAVNQIRNPAKRQIADQEWSRWFRDLPSHPTIQFGVWGDETVAAEKATPEDSEEGDDFVLRVGRPKLTAAPPPPAEIAPWLLSGWEKYDGKVVVISVRNAVNFAGETVPERFDDDPTRTRSLATWKERRDAWAVAERPARLANAVYEEFYDLRAQIERESERIELLIGDGILEWPHPAGRVHHPILLQRLILEFDATIPQFTLREADQPPELYTQLLHSLEDVDGLLVQRWGQSLVENPRISPLGSAATTTFLRGFISSLSPRGQFLDQPSVDQIVGFPSLSRDLVLFTRARNLGFGLAIEGIREDLRSSVELPRPLLNIVGIEATPVADRSEVLVKTVRGNEDSEILLTKPANGEQLEIARRLEKYGCVLVQGPPGTGKTHTIGNLIGHLLAQGKSILVTSHSVKALRVLREQVVEQLQPLCVSVLDAGGENQAQLQGSIDKIVNRLRGPDADTLDREAGAFHKERLEILRQLEQARVRLLEARNDEYRLVVVDGQTWKPSKAARLVAEGKNDNCWIPAPVHPGAVLPISAAEVEDLYHTNVSVRHEDEIELDKSLPDLARLLPPDAFMNATETIRKFGRGQVVVRSDLWQELPIPATPDALMRIVARITEAVGTVQNLPTWRLAAVSAGFAGGVHRVAWDDVIQVIQETNAFCVGADATLMQFGPVLPSVGSADDHLKIATEIADHFARGGGLGRILLATRPTWKAFVSAARIGQRSPLDKQDFEALRILAQIKIVRAKLGARWDLQLVPLGLPASNQLGDDLERRCIQYIPAFIAAMDWWGNNVLPLIDEVQRAGFRWDLLLAEIPPNPVPYGELLRICSAILTDFPQLVSAKVKLLLLQTAYAKLTDLSGYLRLVGDGDPAVVVASLRGGVISHDDEAYRLGYDRVIDLENRRSDLKRRRDLLARLKTVAPKWAEYIRSRQQRHDRETSPGDPVAAWEWRQLNDELDQRAKTSMDALLQEVNRLTESLARVTVSLVDRRAWGVRLMKTDLSQQQALVGWSQTMTRIGHGTGKRVPLLRAKARELMKTARTAVPVWIMPLARVVETYDPRTTKFDVVIIDEASQSDVMALCALYLGRAVVVVGDHEQVSPLAVGQQIEQIQRLIDAHLADIPNSHLYDGKQSVYNLAQSAFGGLICLHEHFRCVPDIIAFSNALSYGGKIIPLRDSTGVLAQPATISHRVDHGAKVGSEKVNRLEALELASLVVAAAHEPEYANSTFGVISLLGDEQDQAREIDTLLRRHIDATEYQRRRIICGNAAHFQGDERDVMFLSIVDSPGAGPLSMRADGPDGIYKKRYNVAASRARDQMWVVHSLNPDTDLQPGDIRRRLIEHALDPKAGLLEQERLRAMTQSPFEQQVLDRLLDAGYRVIPQYPVGPYRIDLVVEGSGRRLAVECDGDRFHTLDTLPADLERQALLERRGWMFVRIRGTVFFRSPDQALQPLFERLQNLEIPREGTGADAPTHVVADSELRQRVVRRAAELRMEWAGPVAEPIVEVITQENPEPPPTPTVRERPEARAVRPRNGIESVPETELRQATELPVQLQLIPVVPQRPVAPVIDLPRDRILKVIARNLGENWHICPGCGGRSNLLLGPLGPYQSCRNPRTAERKNGKFPVATRILNAALRDLKATCPRCASQLVVPAGEFHPKVECQSRTCGFNIVWQEFGKRTELIRV